MITRAIQNHDFLKWSEAFADDHRKAIEHKAAREKWRADEAARMKLPEVFVARSEADYYEPVVRGLLTADIREPGVTERLLQNLLAVHKQLKGERAARG